MQYDTAQRDQLLNIARNSIGHGLRHGNPLPMHLSDLSPALREPRATFVTLERENRLRGCIGSLEPRRPLAQDVAHHAHAAAFQDPRFPPLRDDEWPGTDVHISVLSPAEPMHVASEADLLRQMRPGIDGLIIEEGRARATFLPSVWEQVQDAQEFLYHLKLKAGLPADYWSDKLRVYRYTTESFP